jgi:hypothetical protein
VRPLLKHRFGVTKALTNHFAGQGVAWEALIYSALPVRGRMPRRESSTEPGAGVYRAEAS